MAVLRLDARDPGSLTAFWAGLLHRTVLDDPHGPFVGGSDTRTGLRFVPSAGATTGPGRVHLHVTSTSATDQQRTVAAALDRGARHLDVGQSPQEEHVVLADPEDNAFCVIEPTDAFLSGCGVLGELACDGTRRVGLFWARALDWPLAWDEQEETAVQSPAGGTKIAWGGPPVAPKPARNRQRLELSVTSGPLSAEVERLLALGASLLQALVTPGTRRSNWPTRTATSSTSSPAETPTAAGSPRSAPTCEHPVRSRRRSTRG